MNSIKNGMANYNGKGNLLLRYASLGTHNMGQKVRHSARPSSKFFFHYATEKLHISLMLCEILFALKFYFLDSPFSILKKRARGPKTWRVGWNGGRRSW
jgi:hypothetical protein